MDQSTIIREILDKHEIQDTLYSFVNLLDAKRWKEQVDLYDDGSCLHLPYISVSREQMIAWGDHHILSPMYRTHHVLTSVQIEIDGDTARAGAHLQASHVADQSKPEAMWVIYGIYDFQLRRRTPKWKFTSVTLDFSWETGTPPSYR